MIFTSFKFLIFAAVLIIGYFVLPKKIRWVWLLAGSMYFYLSASVRYSLFLLFSALSVYAFGLFSDKKDSLLSGDIPKEERKILRKKIERQKYFALAVTIIINIGILGVLKYSDFAIGNIESLVRVFIPAFEMGNISFVLPLGISFYTFTAVGYCIDVYRGVSAPEKNPFKLLLFLSFFPHITQGPIDRYEQLAPQLFEGHGFDFKRVSFGLRRALWGLFQKLVIADRLAIAVDTVFENSSDYGGIYLVIAIFFYAIQIYADFAGYMDVALGVSEVMGIYPAENFDSPYFASSVPDFWRRWHMTLGSWFRDYLFYPVMRSKLCRALQKKLKVRFSLSAAGTVVTCIALAIVWFTTGLWHGAAWHYIAWGVYYGFLIILSNVTKPLCDKIKINRGSVPYKVFMTLKTFMLVLFGYILFRAESMTQVFAVIRGIFSPSFGAFLGLDVPDVSVAIVGIIILFVSDTMKIYKKRPRDIVERLPLPIRWPVIYIGIFAVLIFGIYGPDYDAASFIYFQF